MSTTAYFWTHNRLESCEWSPSEMKPNHLASKGEPEGDSTGGPAAASHQRPTAEMCLHPHVTAFKKNTSVRTRVYWTKMKLTRIPANCFSSILQDLVGKDPLPLSLSLARARSLSPCVWDGLVCLSPSKVWSFLRWSRFAGASSPPSRRSLRLCPPFFCAACKCSWSGVAALC